jgi:protein subunit release factor A
MARRTKSLKDIEKQRLRISRALSERAINASQSDFDNLQKRNARTNRIAKRYSENIQKANNWSYMPNSFYGEPEKINKQVAQRTYMGMSNG